MGWTTVKFIAFYLHKIKKNHRDLSISQWFVIGDFIVLKFI